MQVRHSDMAFAGGALIFPGGKLEAGDENPEMLALVDDPDYQPDLRAARIAAIRETFEESGLLLARTAGEPGLPGEITRAEEKFAALLRRNALRAACLDLVHFARWITPEFMPRRFDTQFFLTRAPRVQSVTHNDGESVASFWLRPEEALAAAEQGQYKLLFPTRSILHRLCGDHTLEAHLQTAARTPVTTVTPTLVRNAAGTFVQIPSNAGYTYCEEQIVLPGR